VTAMAARILSEREQQAFAETAFEIRWAKAESVQHLTRPRCLRSADLQTITRRFGTRSTGCRKPPSWVAFTTRAGTSAWSLHGEFATSARIAN